MTLTFELWHHEGGTLEVGLQGVEDSWTALWRADAAGFENARIMGIFPDGRKYDLTMPMRILAVSGGSFSIWGERVAHPGGLA